MDKIDIRTLALAKKYTDVSIAGGGISAGKNCQIKSSTPITGGTRIVFAWYLDNGTEQTTTVDVMNGIDGQDGAKGDTGNGVKSASIVENHLILTLDDDTTVDAGLLTNLDTTFEHIDDISLNNLVDGQILKYNATTGKWENASAGTVDTSLVDLNDVAVDNLTDGQIIVWDATTGRWKNANNSPSITVDSTPTQGSNNAVASGGVYTALQGKANNSDIPTDTSDLNNDSGFITKAVNDLINYYLKSETYTKAEVNALIGAISTIHFEAVLTLPTEDIQTNVIYLVPKSISQSDNIKDEYINLDGTTSGWEKIGETEIDLSNYVTITALNTALADYVTSASLATILASYAQTSQLPGVATASTAGLVKPDGTTTSVNAQGVISVIEQLPAPPVINLESITSENDVNSKSASFTASSTSKYMLIMAIANADYFPTITSASVTVNGDAQTLSNYYASSEYGVNSKYTILDLTSGDTVAASIVSSVESYGASASIMLIKLSEAIGELTLEDSQFSNLSNIASEINVGTDGFYLLFFFKRADGAGRFNAITRNGKTISSNVVICSQGSSWQVSHGICIVSAKALDTLRVAMTAGGFIACGIMSLATSGISYNALDDKPQINGVELSGNKTATQLGLVNSETVGPVESGTTASKAYAVGEHFIRNDKFCTAIAAIASGATLTLNTNYVEGTIAEAVTNKYNYSTTEHVVGKWIDGSDIYQKTYYVSQLGNSGETKEIDISDLNLAQVVDYRGIATDTYGNSFCLPNLDPGGSQYNISLSVHWQTNNKYIGINCWQYDRRNTYAYITILYTKNN